MIWNKNINIDMLRFNNEKSNSDIDRNSFISQYNKNKISWKHLNTILNDIPIISEIFIINRKDQMYNKSGNLRP